MTIRILVAVGAAPVVLRTLASAVRTVILPRVTRSALDRMVFRSLRLVFRAIAGVRGAYAWRDRVMALFAPVGLLALVGIWLTLVTAGFTASSGRWSTGAGRRLFTLRAPPC